MSPMPVVIYVAGSMQQAHLLKNALREAGIEAVVTNDVLTGSAAHVDGWPTAARVVVDAKDADLARQIAAEYEAQAAPAVPERPASDPPELRPPEEWPCCPRCGRPRTTRCLICQTAGSGFPEADSQYVWGMGLGEEPVPGECDPCSCSSAARSPDSEGAPDETDVPPEDGDHATRPLVLVCPTCDEPFVPEFARRCAGCGHDFPEGFEEQGEPAGVSEEFSPRAMAVLLALGVLAAGLAVWFWLMARET